MYLPHINSDKRAKEFNEELNTLNSLIFAKEIKDKESRKGLFSWFKILSKS
ncbi:hypothetical protein H8U70_004524 [Salmonella enterica]|nr:hypothetical protein [Salmonella enterica]